MSILYKYLQNLILVYNCYIANTKYQNAMRYSDPLGSDLVFKVNKVETKVVAQDSSSYATKIEHGYHIYYDIYDYNNMGTVYNPTKYQVYTVNSLHTGYYPSSGGIINQIYSFYIVTINNGSIVQGTNNL